MAKQSATVQRSSIEVTVNGMTVRVEADAVLVTKVFDFLTQIGTEPIKKALNRFGPPDGWVIACSPASAIDVGAPPAPGSLA